MRLTPRLPDAAYEPDDLDAATPVTPQLALWMGALGGSQQGVLGRSLAKLALALRWLLWPVLKPLELSGLWLIAFYKTCISPWLPPACRFHPSCSVYSFEAIKQLGLAKGLALTLFRLVRCQPFCKGGFDPVPPGPGIDEEPPTA